MTKKLTQSRIGKLCGWVDNPWWVEEVVATLPRPVFQLAAPDLVRASGDKGDTMFWQAEEVVLDRILRAHSQEIGDCVSHGWGRGAQDVSLIEIMEGDIDEGHGKKEKWEGEIATEPHYGAGRVEIGGGRIRGSDGSLGAWAAKAAERYGFVLRKDYGGGNDFTRYSGRAAKRLGDDGMPDAIEPEGKKHIIRTVSLVTTAEEARAALQNWYPIPVCSNQGFTMTRDSKGFCQPQGTWHHCMVARGYLLTKGNVPAVVIQQSWGNSPTGPNKVQLEDGREITLPEGCFCVHLEVFGHMVRQGDSFAISNYAGYPARDFQFNFW